MLAEKFSVPQNHLLKDVLGFGNKLASYPGKGKEFAFDFQGKGLDTPFGMLFISFAIKRFLDAHPGVKCRPINFEQRWYASHMGYFHSCGFDMGKLPGEASGSETYLPITILAIDDLKNQAQKEIKRVGEVVEERSKKLAQILTHQSDGPLVDMLTYTLREVIRNVVEHSQSKYVAYCAQYHSTKKQAELAILDTGIGIRQALSLNPHLEIKNDHDALNLAIMPGISGKMYKGVKKRDHDIWQNSGYGLFAVSRLCGHDGKFTICSGDTALTLKRETKSYHPTNFQGTALRIILSATKIENAESILTKIMKEGAKQAKEFKIVGAQASAASKMLSSEFH